MQEETNGIGSEERLVSSLKNVNLRIVNLGVSGSVSYSIDIAKVLSAVRGNTSQLELGSKRDSRVTDQVGARFALNSQWKMIIAGGMS